jgi:hypothetical protein
MKSTQQDQQGGVRTVSGRVADTGSGLSGAGFIPSRTGTGVYTIRFTPPFRAAPEVTASPSQGGGLSANVEHPPDAALITVKTYTNAAAAQDTRFSFIARGLA